MAEREAQTPEQRAALAAVLLNEVEIHNATEKLVGFMLSELEMRTLPRDAATLARHVDVAKKQHAAALRGYRAAMGMRP